MDQPNQNQPVSPVTPQMPAQAQPTPAVQTPAPIAPSPSVTPPMDQPKPHKKPFLLIFGIFLVVLLLAGGAVYVMQLSQRTKRLNMYEPTPVTQSTPTLTEEQEINSVDTGDPTTDITGIETDINQIN